MRTTASTMSPDDVALALAPRAWRMQLPGSPSVAQGLAYIALTCVLFVAMRAPGVAAMRRDQDPHATQTCSTPIEMVVAGDHRLGCGDAGQPEIATCGLSTLAAGDRVVMRSSFFDDEAICHHDPQGMAAGLRLMQGLPLLLNRASTEDLTRLDGLGIKRARAIVAYRDRHGFYRTVDDLQRVHGIGPKTVARLARWLRCDLP